MRILGTSDLSDSSIDINFTHTHTHTHNPNELGIGKKMGGVNGARGWPGAGVGGTSITDLTKQSGTGFPASPRSLTSIPKFPNKFASSIPLFLTRPFHGAKNSGNRARKGSVSAKYAPGTFKEPMNSIALSTFCNTFASMESSLRPYAIHITTDAAYLRLDDRCMERGFWGWVPVEMGFEVLGGGDEIP